MISVVQTATENATLQEEEEREREKEKEMGIVE